MNDNSKIYVLQEGALKGYKNNNYGNYEVIFDFDTPSGISVVAESLDGQIVGYGGLIAVGTNSSPNLDAGGGVSIRSVQSDSIPIAVGLTTITKTITAVDMTKSVIIDGFGTVNSASTTNYANLEYYYTFDNSTTVRLTRGSNSYYAVESQFTVLEFADGVNVQRGVKSFSAAVQSTTHTLSSTVDTSKSVIIISGMMIQSDGNMSLPPRVYLSDSSTITFARNHSAGSLSFTCSWQVLEFE